MAQRTTSINLDDERPKITQRKVKTENFGNPSSHSHSVSHSLLVSLSCWPKPTTMVAAEWVMSCFVWLLHGVHTGEDWWRSAKLQQRLSLYFLKAAAYPRDLVWRARATRSRATLSRSLWFTLMPPGAGLTFVMNRRASREGNLLFFMIRSNVIHPFIIVYYGMENRGLILSNYIEMTH
jgi:hypothetical protein